MKKNICFVIVLFFFTFTATTQASVINEPISEAAHGGSGIGFEDGIAGFYVDNNNGTITDIGTGLIWQKPDANRVYRWDDACDYCENLNLAGYNDWILPDIYQLETLIDEKKPPVNRFFFQI